MKRIFNEARCRRECLECLDTECAVNQRISRPTKKFKGFPEGTRKFNILEDFLRQRGALERAESWGKWGPPPTAEADPEDWCTYPADYFQGLLYEESAAASSEQEKEEARDRYFARHQYNRLPDPTFWENVCGAVAKIVKGGRLLLNLPVLEFLGFNALMWLAPFWMVPSLLLSILDWMFEFGFENSVYYGLGALTYVILAGIVALGEIEEDDKGNCRLRRSQGWY